MSVFAFFRRLFAGRPCDARSAIFSRDYDFVVSLGYSCPCATNLRRLGLRSCSLPFDWVICGTIEGRLRLLETHFEGFLSKDRLVKLEPVKSLPDKGNDHYRDEGSGLNLYHDFRRELPFDEAYRQVKEKYDRRIARLYERVVAARRTLFVWRDDPIRPFGESERRAAEDRLRAVFPTSDVSLLVIADDDDFRRIRCSAAAALRRRIALKRLGVRMLTWVHFSRAARSAARRRLEEKWGLE